MANQDSELPEGTDKVISGASLTTTPTADGSAGDDEGEILISTDASAAAIPPAATGQAGGPGSSTGSGRVIDKLRSGGGKLSGQAADKARGFVAQGVERSAEALANVGRLVGDTATGLDERLGEDYGNYARRAAEAIENAANNIASKDPDELIDDTRNFVRKSPGVALAGAAVAGFVIARLVKSGLAAATGRDDDDDDDRSAGSRTSGKNRSSEA